MVTDTEEALAYLAEITVDRARGPWAVQVLRARLAELEAENERVHAELTAYGDKYAASQRQLAERGEPTGTEWGVRWHADRYRLERRANEGDARTLHAQYPMDTELIHRTLGPWRVAT